MLKSATSGLDLLLTSTDGVKWYSGLVGLPPSDKAQVILARARMRGVTGKGLLEMVMGVAAMIREMGGANSDYIFCQIAKPVVRLHTPTAWRPNEAGGRSSGKMLRVLGKTMWSFASIIATGEVLDEVVRLAEPKVAAAKKREARRKSSMATKSRTRDAIARVIMQARERGAGRDELAQIELFLYRRYGLKAPVRG
jgi:hypothetical protein